MGEFMARHRLTAEEQKRGVQRALESPRTPPQLKRGLQKRQEQLEGGGTGDWSGSTGETSRPGRGSKRGASGSTANSRVRKRASTRSTKGTRGRSRRGRTSR